jgi:hypothetical protein
MADNTAVYINQLNIEPRGDGITAITVVLPRSSVSLPDKSRSTEMRRRTTSVPALRRPASDAWTSQPKDELADIISNNSDRDWGNAISSCGQDRSAMPSGVF